MTALMETGQFYALAFIQILIEPGQFFKKLPEKTGPARSLGFLTICNCFFVMASLLTGACSLPVWEMALTTFAGSMGMVFMSSVLGYLAMVMVTGRLKRFETIFCLYVFSTGVTLFVSWLPFLFWLTEPWKWWLVYTGFKNICLVSGKQALFILVLSMSVQTMLMNSAHLTFLK